MPQFRRLKRKRGRARYKRKVRGRPLGAVPYRQRGFLRTGGFYGRFAGAGGEMKFHDVTIDDTTIAVNGTVQAEMLKIPEGNGEEQRIGRSIVIKKLIYRYSIKLPTTATANSTSDTVRIMLIQDKQCNSALPLVADVLATDFYLGLNEMANSKRFRTLWDKIYSMNSVAGAGNGTTNEYCETVINDQVYLNLNVPIEYNNATSDGAIATVRSNNIFAIFLSSDGLCGLVGRMRFRYSDR